VRSRLGRRPAAEPRFASRLSARWLILPALLGLASSARPQGEIEPFPSVDPYTKNDPGALEKAGYVSFGPFRFGDDHTTEQIESVLGGMPIIWVETAHFKLGSGLPECDVGVEKRDKERVKAELEQLRQLLPDVKTKPKKLDPWLRLHLFALRLEELYADFQQRFGVKDADFPTAPPDPAKPAPGPYMGQGRYLGMPSKFAVLIFDKKTSLGRYSSVYLGMTLESSYRWLFPETGSLLYLTATDLHDADYQSDAAIGCDVISGVTKNLANGFRYYAHVVPFYWSEGLAHWFSRRFDPRYHFFTGTDPSRIRTRDEWNWEPSVRARVKNEVFPPTAQMLAWEDPNALEWADHVILWSRVDYLMAREDGAGSKLMRYLKDPLPPGRPTEDAVHERSLQAFQEATGQDPAAFDAAWCDWVEENYPAK
jgi:hypothetical protein